MPRRPSAWIVDRLEIVGAVPYQGEATATADAYTYGATSEALAQGQAMAAWADLQAKQASIPTKVGSLGPPTCPNGFLLSLPNQYGIQTCVNQRNVHIQMAWSEQCKENYRNCSILPRWFALHHPVAFSGMSTSVEEAQKLLPRALAELGLLAPGRLDDLKGEVHALAWRVHQAAVRDQGTSLPLVEAALLATAAPLYNDCAERGVDCSPQWVTEQVGLSSGSSTLGWLVLAGIATAGLYVASPSTARRVTGAATGAAGSAYRKLRGAL